MACAQCDLETAEYHKLVHEITLPRGKSGHLGAAARFPGLARGHTRVTHTQPRGARSPGHTGHTGHTGRLQRLLARVTLGHSPPPAASSTDSGSDPGSGGLAASQQQHTATAPRRTGPCSCRQWLSAKRKTKLTHVAAAAVGGTAFLHHSRHCRHIQPISPQGKSESRTWTRCGLRGRAAARGGPYRCCARTVRERRTVVRRRPPWAPSSSDFSLFSQTKWILWI